MHPHDILDVALGALVVLEAQIPSRPDVTKAVGRALLAVDALQDLAASATTSDVSGGNKRTVA